MLGNFSRGDQSTASFSLAVDPQRNLHTADWLYSTPPSRVSFSRPFWNTTWKSGKSRHCVRYVDGNRIQHGRGVVRLPYRASYRACSSAVGTKHGHIAFRQWKSPGEYSSLLSLVDGADRPCFVWLDVPFSDRRSRRRGDSPSPAKLCI